MISIIITANLKFVKLFFVDYLIIFIFKVLKYIPVTCRIHGGGAAQQSNLKKKKCNYNERFKQIIYKSFQSKWI